jgi:hypothetical protein
LNSRQNSNRAPSHARPASDEEIEAEENLAKEAALILARVQKKPARARVCAPHPHWNEKKRSVLTQGKLSLGDTG